MGESRGTSDRGEEARQRSREVAQQGQEKASEYAQQGRQQATSQIAQRKEQASGQLDGIVSALRQAGSQLHEQDQAPVGRYVEQAADQTERLSNYLRDRDADRLIGDVEDFARNRPAVFLGGAFLLGAAAARFLKSSAGQREEFDVREQARELGSAVTSSGGSGGESGSTGESQPVESRTVDLDDEVEMESPGVEDRTTSPDGPEEEESTRRGRRRRRGSR